MIAALRRRVSALHDNHKRIIAGAALIGILTIVAKLFAIGREIAIAWRFGISGPVDAYQLALTMATWLPMLLTGVITAVLVPRLVAVRRQTHRYASFIAELNGSLLMLALSVAGLSFAAIPVVSAILAPKMNPDTLAMTSSMARWLTPVAFCSVLSGYLSARLQALERFSYSVTEAAPALTIATVVLVPLPWPATERLAGGTALGFFIQLGLLVWMIRNADGGIGGLRVRHRSAEWGTLYGSIIMMAVAQATIAITIPIDQGFAARIGPGSVATMAYANRFLVLITGFGAVVLARALLPVLSAASSAGDLETGARHALRWSLLLFGCGAAGAAGIWLLSDRLVDLAFRRGAFTQGDANLVAGVLRLGTIQLPFYFGGLALVQWIAARGRYSSLLAVACIALVIKLFMNLLLVPKLGVGGIMLATAAMYGASFACQYVAASRK